MVRDVDYRHFGYEKGFLVVLVVVDFELLEQTEEASGLLGVLAMGLQLPNLRNLICGITLMIRDVICVRPAPMRMLQGSAIPFRQMSYSCYDTKSAFST